MALKITIEELKELRKYSGRGVVECKKAFIKANGDINKAKLILRNLPIISIYY